MVLRWQHIKAVRALYHPLLVKLSSALCPVVTDPTPSTDGIFSICPLNVGETIRMISFASKFR